MSFWKKTYVLTLVIVITAFVGMVFYIGYSSHSVRLKLEMEKRTSEHAYIEQMLTRDYEEYEKAGEDISGLINFYGDYYSIRGMGLAVKGEQEENYRYDRVTGKILLPDNFLSEEGVTSGFVKNGGQYYAVVSSRKQGGLSVITSTEVTELYREMQDQNDMYTMICLSVSLVLAVALFFVLRMLSKPLQRLAGVSDEIADGDYDKRLPVKGKDEIARLSESFNHMADSLVAKMDELALGAEQKERISDNLSHEIRTPLTAIQGYAEYLLLANVKEREKNEVLGYIMDESKRLQKISVRMLQLSEMRRDEIELVPMDIRPLIQQCVVTLSARAADADVELTVSGLQEAEILGDAILLESLVTNIGDNAIKACTEKGKVDLSLALHRSHVILTIQDNGRGMTKEEVDKLGEPFYRPDKARSRMDGGAGLGITLCRQIARLHRAGLTYSSRPGEGTRVEIRLRRHRKTGEVTDETQR